METAKDRVDEKVERWKATAEIFLKNNIQAFVKDVSGDIYFCDILLVGDDALQVKCFGPNQRKDKKFNLYWPLIEEFGEYKEKGDLI